MLSKTSSVKIKKSLKKKYDGNIPKKLIYEVALELMSRAAIGIPGDFKTAIKTCVHLRKARCRNLSSKKYKKIMK